MGIGNSKRKRRGYEPGAPEQRIGMNGEGVKEEREERGRI